MLRFKKVINVFRCYVFLGSEANIHRTNDALFKSCQASNRTNVYSCRIKGKVVLFYDFVVRSIFACNIPIFKLITLLYETLTIANRQNVLNRIVFITLRNLLNDIAYRRSVFCIRRIFNFNNRRPTSFKILNQRNCTEDSSQQQD